MNIRVALIAMAFTGASAQALAIESSTVDNPQGTPVEDYAYGDHPDIAKVLSTSEVPNVCGPVSVEMAYEDSTGQRHIMRYQVIGNGCSNG
ncbi:MAG TPA: DUF2790 domain-containing protein [Pseudomonas sp.]|jgi:hypothetical protein